MRGGGGEIDKHGPVVTLLKIHREPSTGSLPENKARRPSRGIQPIQIQPGFAREQLTLDKHPFWVLDSTAAKWKSQQDKVLS